MVPITPLGPQSDPRLHSAVAGTRPTDSERRAEAAPQAGAPASAAPVDRVELSDAARAPAAGAAAVRGDSAIPVSTLDPARHREVMQRVVDRFYDRQDVRQAVAAQLATDLGDAGASGAESGAP